VPMSAVPVYSGNPFSEENLRDSKPLYKELRDLGRLVWVPELDLYVAARFEDVQKGLRSPKVLISSNGVVANPAVNTMSAVQASTILSDGQDHLRFKKVLSAPLMPKPIEGLRGRLTEMIDEKVAQLVNAEPFDAMREIASLLPIGVVAEMIGLRGFTADQMLFWSDAMFDGFAPPSARNEEKTQTANVEFFKFLMSQNRDNLVPGSLGSKLFEAVDAGELVEQEALGLLGDYIVPSLDTTILSTGEMLYRLAVTPGAWDAYVANPDLAPKIILEAVRMASVIRGFTRYAAEDYPVGDFVVPKGARVWLINAAANLDERKYPDPDDFKVDRDPRDQLAWGHGVHLCVGKHLAQLEMETILGSLLRKVERLEVVGEPTPLINSGIQGFENLQMRLHAKA